MTDFLKSVDIFSQQNQSREKLSIMPISTLPQGFETGKKKIEDILFQTGTEIMGFPWIALNSYTLIEGCLIFDFGAWKVKVDFSAENPIRDVAFAVANREIAMISENETVRVLFIEPEGD